LPRTGGEDASLCIPTDGGSRLSSDHTASVIHALATAFGLAAPFTYWPPPAGIKYCRAGYLIYLGITGFRAGGIVGLAGQVMGSRPLSLAKVYRQGVLTDLLNPKALLFLFSFLPQFADSARGAPCLQMLVLGLLFQVTGVPTNLIVALAGAWNIRN
jgi:threonine/homoserine/homoserine lactone efflux protein